MAEQGWHRRFVTRSEKWQGNGEGGPEYGRPSLVDAGGFDRLHRAPHPRVRSSIIPRPQRSRCRAAPGWLRCGPRRNRNRSRRGCVIHQVGPLKPALSRLDVGGSHQHSAVGCDKALGKRRRFIGEAGRPPLPAFYSRPRSSIMASSSVSAFSISMCS